MFDLVLRTSRFCVERFLAAFFAAFFHQLGHSRFRRGPPHGSADRCNKSGDRVRFLNVKLAVPTAIGAKLP